MFRSCVLSMAKKREYTYKKWADFHKAKLLQDGGGDDDGAARQKIISFLKPQKLLKSRYEKHEKWSEIVTVGQNWCLENPKGTKEGLRAHILERYGETELALQMRANKIRWAVELSVERIRKMMKKKKLNVEPQMEKIQEAATAWVAKNDYASKPMIEQWAREQGAKMYVQRILMPSQLRSAAKASSSYKKGPVISVPANETVNDPKE